MLLRICQTERPEIEHPITSAPMGLAPNELYWNAYRDDAENAGVLVGEAAGLVCEIQPARRIREDLGRQAEKLLVDKARLRRPSNTIAGT